MAIAMSPHSYKTNRLLWFFAVLVCLLLSSYDLQCILGLFSGQSRIGDLFSFEFIAPMLLSIVTGWLAQCAIIIVLSWRHGKTKHQFTNLCPSVFHLWLK
jgi:hypothetical protein